MANILQVHEGDWAKVTSSSKPVFVDFWAAWCGPCRMVAPVFEKLAEKYQDAADFAKVDVDELQDLAGELGIRSIPTLMLFNKGQVVERIVGLRPYEELAEILDRHVKLPAS